MTSNSKIKGRPLIGIFWIHNNELIEVHAEPIDAGVDDSMFVNSSIDHYSFWNSLKRSTDLVDLEYDEVPRGRIVYNKNEGIFHAFGPRKLINNSKIQSLILSEFNLSRSKTKFMDDAPRAKFLSDPTSPRPRIRRWMHANFSLLPPSWASSR